MAISKIQYDDKVAINIDSTIPDINKCNASDLNEIKSVVNNNADEIPTISDEYGTSTADGYSQNYINENTINPSGEPSTSEEDVSSATFTNTLEAPMNIDLKGNTLQNGTPTPSSPIPINNVSGDNQVVVCGKNLFDKDTGIITPGYYGTNGNLITTDTTLSCQSTYIKAKPNTSYTISSNASTLYRICEYDSSKTFIKRTYNENANNSFTITTGNTTEYIRMGGTLTTALDSVQIEEGNQATPYEAYNGTTYNIDLPVENLYNIATNTNGKVIGTDGSEVDSTGYCISDYIAVQPNTTYTISRIYENLPSSEDNMRLGLYTQNKTWIQRVNSSNKPYVYTTPSNCYFIRLSYQYTITNTNVQVELGSKANTYTPYGTTPIELNKIGNYQDKIYKENGTWYLHKEIGKVVLDGTTNRFTNRYTTNTNNYYRHVWENGSVKNQPSGTIANAYCNKLSPVSIGSTYGCNQGVSINDTNHRIIMYINDIREMTIEQANQWLETNNIIVYYLIDTPTNTEITYTPLIEQLESIKNAMSKAGTTNVNQVNNDLPFILDLSVFNDTYNGRYQSVLEMYKRLSN